MGTAVLLAWLALLLSQMISLPVIGDDIAERLDIVDGQRETKYINR
ncbi:hypothetical protein HNR44_000379 [Geomicrobium halophilum]|uniref:Uncharacterized protein n=1 Tax=Geomicrobium halophilum TaxID=549000 RepID=A0A841PI11_9BACL|nr:DUF5665 domain-containing protein [Geomicrobium halophilum]MBB6448430.1 hypothetical protein [Geomicrobium halophilum]